MNSIKLHSDNKKVPEVFLSYKDNHFGNGDHAYIMSTELTDVIFRYDHNKYKLYLLSLNSKNFNANLEASEIFLVHNLAFIYNDAILEFCQSIINKNTIGLIS